MVQNTVISLSSYQKQKIAEKSEQGLKPYDGKKTEILNKWYTQELSFAFQSLSMNAAQ